MANYAHIIVDISTEKLDHPFSYHVPDKLKDLIHVGSAVTFPFGAGNTIRKGYVLTLDDECGFDPSRIKDIIAVDDKKTDINSQMISLAWWMKTRYGSTMNQAMKTVMPVKAKVEIKYKNYIHLLASEDEVSAAILTADKRKARAQAAVLRALVDEPYIEQSLLCDRWNVSSATIKALSDKGYVEIVKEEKYKRNQSSWNTEYTKKELNSQQQKAYEDMLLDYRSEKKHTWLLQGITGSGKTEVYLELIEQVIKDGRQVIVLIPEISLTPQTVMRFFKRFGDRIATVHSRLAAGEKYREFQRAKNGEIDIMIGPRSALFTPFPNLGLIIIDEEHEDSYKSEITPKYNAKEVAIRRCEMSDAMVVLGSATPSLESRFLADAGIYKKALLTVRGAADAVLPQVHVVDMRQELKEKNRSILSRRLREKIQDRLEKKEQIMLFLNRRGYSNCVSCRSCGSAVMCENCDISMTLHDDNTLRCHYCGFKQPLMKLCPSCSSPFLAGLGIGTERATELVQEEFPKARILRMDMDSTSKAGSHEAILSAFGNGEADILLGTQMIVKGHDFSNVTLVGILVADKSLYASTYRAAEKTFQLLTQAAGRAGRGKIGGEVVIQTYRPEHFAISTASRQDYESFYLREIMFRKNMNYPPVSRMLSILITSPAETDAQDASEKIAEMIKKRNIFIVNGPTPDSIGKINNQFRRMIFVRSKDIDALIKLQDELNFKINKDKWRELAIECNLT